MRSNLYYLNFSYLIEPHLPVHLNDQTEKSTNYSQRRKYKYNSAGSGHDTNKRCSFVSRGDSLKSMDSMNISFQFCFRKDYPIIQSLDKSRKINSTEYWICHVFPIQERVSVREYDPVTMSSPEK